MSYVVRQRRTVSEHFLLPAVGLFGGWSTFQQPFDVVTIVIGVVWSGGLIALGLRSAWSAARREIVVAVDPDGIVLGGLGRSRCLPWSQVAGAQVYFDPGGLESDGGYVVQVRSADGAVDETWTNRGDFDPEEFLAAVQEIAPPSVADTVGDRTPEDRWPTDPLAFLGPVHSWADGIRERRRGR